MGLATQAPPQSALWQQLATRAALDPHAPALLQPGLGAFTFEQLARMLDDLTATLRSAGLGPTDTVAILQPDGVCGLISLLGAARLCAACPIDPALTPVELERDLRQLGAAALIVEAASPTIHALAQTLGFALLEARSATPRCSWQLLRALDPDALRLSNAGAMLLLHTSATTGRRKLVPLTQANIAAMIRQTMAVTHLRQTDRVLLIARQFHIQGALSVLAQLSVGGSVIVPPQLAPAFLLETIATLQPTWYTCGPTMHRALLTEIERSGAPIPQWLRLIRSAGAPLTPALYQELTETLRVPVLNVYGLTETGGLTSTSFEGPTPRHSVGRSMGDEIATMRADGVLLEPGEEGEIVVSGPTVTPGYLHNEEANHKAFHKGWFRTGDLGRIDADGFLYLTGRLKEVINRGGEKIIPDEVDAVLAQHPAVREVATFAIPHATLGEDVACAIVLRPGATATPAELQGFAQTQLAPFKLPRQIFFRDIIPRGSTGKPQRLALRNEYAHPDTSAVPHAPSDAPSTAPPTAPPQGIEEFPEIFRLWSSLLNRTSIGLHDDFFALGGDSLSAVTMLAAVDSLFGFTIPLSAERFLEDPTLAGLLHMLNQADTPPDEASESILYPLRSGAGPTLFLLPANDSKGLYFRRLARHMTPAWSSIIVRPAERGPFRRLYPIEDAAGETVSAVRAAQPVGPYLLAGFCQGGVVAFEAASRLERLGYKVLLVLFDTPTPGGVHVVRQWTAYNTNVRAKLEHARQSATLQPVLRAGRSLTRRMVWLTLRRFRPVVNALWRVPGTQQLTAWATRSNFSFYRAHPATMPILHFLAADETSPMRAASRRGWQRITTAPVTYHSLPGNHDTLFAEANLPEMSALLESWLAQNLPDRQHEARRLL